MYRARGQAVSRYLKSVRLEETSNPRLASECVITDAETIRKEKEKFNLLYHFYHP
jgi:hypothetical protein